MVYLKTNQSLIWLPTWNTATIIFVSISDLFYMAHYLPGTQTIASIEINTSVQTNWANYTFKAGFASPSNYKISSQFFLAS